MSLLSQLNKTLALQLANLAKTDDDELETEIKRSKAICDVSKQIIDSHRVVVVDATKLQLLAGGFVEIDEDLLSIGHEGIGG